jgi:hypothetical protein
VFGTLRAAEFKVCGNRSSNLPQLVLAIRADSVIEARMSWLSSLHDKGEVRSKD